MSDWAQQASWETLITVIFRERDSNPQRFDEAVEEVYRRIPRASDYNRVISERFQVPKPLGSAPDWEPSGLDGPKEKTWLVRLLGNDGRYPSKPLFYEDWAVLASDGDIVWSAVYREGEHPNDESEISWLHRNEVLFLAAVSLAEQHPQMRGRPWLRWRSSPTFIHLQEPFTPETLLEKSREVARILASEHPDRLIPQIATAPNILDDGDYTEHVRDLLECMNTIMEDDSTNDAVLLLRGLYKFLMACEMIFQPHLTEEATISAYISREAALELLRRKLSAEAGKRLTKDDVLAHIRAEFPTGDPFVDVLEQDWENRVIMIHPLSKHGAWWSPPVYKEECFEAVHNLVYLYRYLLLDEVWDPDSYEHPLRERPSSDPELPEASAE